MNIPVGTVVVFTQGGACGLPVNKGDRAEVIDDTVRNLGVRRAVQYVNINLLNGHDDPDCWDLYLDQYRDAWEFAEPWWV